jgi:phosphatidylinositol-3,4,5-trisphosphate 3-phosphatase/dual-specificity protein phosphatase PTEN
MACTYLLTLDNEPSPPKLERNYSKKELVRRKMPLAPPEPAQPAAVSAESKQTPTESEHAEKAEESAAKKERAVERAEEIMNEMPADEAAAAPAPDTDTDEELGGASASTTSLPKSEAGVSKTKLSTDAQDTAVEAKEDGVEPHDFSIESSTPVPAVATGNVLGAREVDTPVQKASVHTPDAATPTSTTSKRKSLAAVLDLHTARRMRPESPSSSSPSSSSSSSSSSNDNKKEETGVAQGVERPGPPPKTGRAGVSIPSQRRWLWYWSLLLADEGPAGLWPALPHPPTTPDHDPAPPPARVRLLDLQVRMKEGGGVAASAVKAASMLLGRFGEKSGREPEDLWVSLARYDDPLVEKLEQWERWSRDHGVGGMGRRRRGADEMPGAGDVNLREEIKHIFKDGKWDKGKMVKSFGRLVVENGKEVRVCHAQRDAMSLLTQAWRAGARRQGHS